jgi:hypothetical protein
MSVPPHLRKMACFGILAELRRETMATLRLGLFSQLTASFFRKSGEGDPLPDCINKIKTVYNASDMGCRMQSTPVHLKQNKITTGEQGEIATIHR